VHPKSKQLEVRYNGDAIRFLKISKDHFVSAETIELARSDQVLIDDNLDQPAAIRFLFDEGDFKCRYSFFTLFQPLSPGKKTFCISYDYALWYEVNFALRAE
jgi:hypothetical protein